MASASRSAFDSLDGTKLHGWLFRSSRSPAKAVIVHYHGNAENIAIEFHERYLAARRAAPTKKAARARKPEPRASAGFTIARAHRMGFWKG